SFSADGKLRWDADGTVVDLPGENLYHLDRGIYAASCTGKLNIAPRNPGPHSALWGGAHVLGAGETLALAGELCYVDNRTGPYRPTRAQFEAFLHGVLSRYQWDPVQKMGDIHYAVPAGASAACRDRVAAYVGIVTHPDPLHLEAEVGGVARATIRATNHAPET